MVELMGWGACLGLGLMFLGGLAYHWGSGTGKARRAEAIERAVFLHRERERRIGEQQRREFDAIAERLRADDPDWLNKYTE
jgi:hypothetical protein